MATLRSWTPPGHQRRTFLAIWVCAMLLIALTVLHVQAGLVSLLIVLLATALTRYLIKINRATAARDFAQDQAQDRTEQLRMWQGITPRFAARSWDARLGARRAVWRAKQATCNDAACPNPQQKIGEVIVCHILSAIFALSPDDRAERTAARRHG